MSEKRNRAVEPPLYLRERMPSPEQLIECFSREGFSSEAQAQLFRAAYVSDGVLPTSVARPYRFGPPPNLFRGNTEMPFWWLYAAHVAETAIWEAQFCKNDVTRPGTFYLDSFAVENGIIAELRFPRALRFWNFNGSVASRLGIYDEISSPDYEWCQWFGYHIDEAMQSAESAERPDGFIYPSRRHRGHTAVAISSRVLTEMRDGIKRTEMPFNSHPDFKRLLNDGARVAPPDR